VKKIVFLLILFLSMSVSISAQEYKFKKGDYIVIFVYNSPELTGEFGIHPDGNIRLPLIGKIYVLGKTEKEINEIIRKEITRYIKNPYITIYPKYTVSVVGFVRNPSVIMVTGSERLIEIIAQAGGFSPEASGKVIIYRNNKKINISKKNIFAYDSEFGYIEPGDVIIAKKKLLTRNDYSVFLSTLSVIAVVSYYITRY